MRIINDILDFSKIVAGEAILDPVPLRQILVNLVNNAVKFTARGYVKIAVTLVAETKQDVTVIFEVTDTGIGIPVRDHEAKTQTHTPIVALTAHAWIESHDRSLISGVGDYLCKPFSLQQLQTVIERWLT